MLSPPRNLVPGIPVCRLSLVFPAGCNMVMRGGNPLAKEQNVKKLIFASLLSVGALLVTQMPIFAAQTSTTKTSKKNMKKHHKKSTSSSAKTTK